MYGGLFGDLPCAKSSEKNEDQLAADRSTQTPAPDLTQPSSTATSNVLSRLGNAGTAMAFIPTTVRPRKRPNQSSNKSRASASTPSDVSQSRPGPISLHPPRIDGPRDQNEYETVAIGAASKPDERPFFVNEVEPMRELPRIDRSGKDETEPLSLTTEACIEQEISDRAEVSSINKTAVDPNSTSIDEPGLTDEALQRLHASVTDPYDPHVPNDLLSFREHQKLERERLALEKEAREILERQQHLRQQLEEERQRVQASGCASDIIEHRTKVRLTSGGRGRGINNLPAWLLQQQQDELRPAAPVGGRTVILSNLTSPGEIDTDLGVEVQDECEELCGPVIDVQVKDAEPPHQPEVQVQVQFQNVADAAKAATMFHGRMFGQRRITARQLSENGP